MDCSELVRQFDSLIWLYFAVGCVIGGIGFYVLGAVGIWAAPRLRRIRRYFAGC